MDLQLLIHCKYATVCVNIPLYRELSILCGCDQHWMHPDLAQHWLKGENLKKMYVHDVLLV